MKARTIRTAALVLILGGTASAQEPSALQGDALLRALLTEMQILRVTLQHNAATELRARVLLERLRIQQDVVRELQREVGQRQLEEEFRLDRMEMEPFEQELENLEIRMRDATDPATKRQLEQELAGISKRREMFQRQREHMQVRFQRQEQRLAEESARLRGIEDELQRLANALAPASVNTSQ